MDDPAPQDLAAQYTEALVKFDEGDRSQKYLDSRGIPSIGRGHNLKASSPCAQVVSIQTAAGLPPDDQWTPESIEIQYQYDLTRNCGFLWSKPWWTRVDPARQAALNDMAFNLGPSVAQSFTTFYSLVAVLNWEAAADDLAKTEVATIQLPKRYGRLCNILRTGVMPEGIA